MRNVNYTVLKVEASDRSPLQFCVHLRPSADYLANDVEWLYTKKIKADHNPVHYINPPSLTTLLATFILFQPLFPRRIPVNLELIYCSA